MPERARLARLSAIILWIAGCGGNDGTTLPIPGATPSPGSSPTDVPAGTTATPEISPGPAVTVTPDHSTTPPGPPTATLPQETPAETTPTPPVGNELPPDPASVAPPLDPTVTTSTAQAVSFLYEGENAIQKGVEPGTIEPGRVAVILGRLLTREGEILSGVEVSVLDHPELGYTLSRADGWYDLAVNGGSWVTLHYRLEGYSPAQRTVMTAWDQFTAAPDVRLVELDPVLSLIDFSEDMQVARGSLEADDDGLRQATVLFPAGAEPWLVLPDGSTEALSSLHVRATEYTVGPNGPEAMPGQLPATSGYTYAVELSVDEALEAGASEVGFREPVIFYVENFLEFPVGGIVPAGYYDFARGLWVPSANGRILEVLAIEEGLAVLDVDGGGAASSPEALAALGISGLERERLASLYLPGQSLWRVAIEHFTPWDCNWPYGPPPDAPAPEPCQGRECDPRPEPDPCEQVGSIIECQNQVLGEQIDLVGVPGTLSYRNNRTLGWVAGRRLRVPLTGDELHPDLKRIELEIVLADHVERATYAAAPGLSHTWTWDGMVYGRPWQGERKGAVTIGYVYPATYYTPSEWTQSFAQYPSGTTIIGSRAAGEITLETRWEVNLVNWDSAAWAVAGWTLEMHHVYDPETGTIYYGDGRQRQGTALGHVITTVAGTGVNWNGGDGGPATLAGIEYPFGLALDAQGSLFIADTSNHRIRRVSPEGTITTVAGTGIPGYGGDAGPATAAKLYYPHGVAVEAGGRLFIADSSNHRIRQVSSDGTITAVAGTGTAGYSGDGGPATEAMLSYPLSVSVDAGGRLFIADTHNSRVRQVSPEGTITTVGGTGTAGYSGDGGPATRAALSDPFGVGIDAAGQLFIADTGNSRIRRVSPEGTISTVAGGGGVGYEGDGGPATKASLYYPSGVAVDAWGRLFIADTSNQCIRQVSADGTITTVAGTGTAGHSGDGGPAVLAGLNIPRGVTVDASGRLLVADSGNNRVRQVALLRMLSNDASYLVPSEDGQELYVFDAAGRHLETHDSATYALRYRFSYDDAGRLFTVTDGDGLVTTLERDAAGTPTAIVGPYGQRTTLEVNAEGNLSAVYDPSGAFYQLGYDSGGLLTNLVEPDGTATEEPNDFVHAFAYDALGRLVRDADPAGGERLLSPEEDGSGYAVTVNTALGRATVYAVVPQTTGGQVRETILPNGASITAIRLESGRELLFPDGSSASQSFSPDPRWGMWSPLISEASMTVPSGLVNSRTHTRTVTLADTADPLSMTSQTDTVTLNGQTYTSIFDANSGIQTLTTPEGRKTTRTYDAQGRLTGLALDGMVANAVGEPVQLASLEIDYDNDGRVAEVRRGDRVARFTYYQDASMAGFLSAYIDPEEQQTSFSYDAAGRVTTVLLPGGEDDRVLEASYDPEGNLTSLTPPGRPTHELNYSPVHFLEAYWPPELEDDPSGPVDFTYTVDGELSQVSWFGGTIDLEFDPTAGQQTALELPEERLELSYLPSGQLEAIASADQALSFAYDGPLLTRQSWAGAVSGAVTLTYDSDFRVSTETVVGGQSISLAYDADGLLASAGSLELTSDPASGLLLGTTQGVVSDGFGVNPYGEWMAYEARIEAVPVYAVSVSSRNALGRLVSWTETLEDRTRALEAVYDETGRLVEAWEDGILIASYGYDLNGNRLSAITSEGSVGPDDVLYDAQDRLLRYGSRVYTYDGLGMRSSRTDETLSGTTRYSYDGLGRLREVTLADGTGISYLLDGWGRRIGKRIDGTLVQAWLYGRQPGPIAELDGAGQVVSQFVYGSRPHVPDYLIRGGKTYRILSDHLGSPRLVIDSSSGAIVQRLRYDLFGSVLEDTNPGFQPFGFAGGLYDRDTGLVRFGARDYDPEVGRWTAKDPILFAGEDTNLYGYALNDPLNYADPSGFAIETGWDAFNVGTGLASLATNVATGNTGGALVDAAGLAYDVAATAVPGLPGGASTAIRYYRGSKLARNLVKDGRGAIKGLEECHHIVARAAKKAEPARKILKALGIDIDDAVNGTPVFKGKHRGVHTDSYYERINEAARSWTTAEDAIEWLQGEARRLGR